MSLLSTLVGISAGVFVRTYANAMMKVRLLRKPWQHVFYGMLGGYIGYNYPKYEQKLLQEVNDLRQERGLPPLKRRGGWAFDQLE